MEKIHFGMIPSHDLKKINSSKKKVRGGGGEKIKKKKIKKHVMFCEAAYQSESTESENSKNSESEETQKPGFFDKVLSFVNRPTRESEKFSIKCVYCRREFDDDEIQDVLFIENCSHILCKEGLGEIAEKEYGQMQNIGGPKGKATILDAELQMALGEEKYDDTIVRGNGGNVMMVTKGTIDYSLKDEKGNTLTKKAAKHMSKYRIRCNSCGNNFGTKGKVEPYHIGKSGREYKKFKKAKKGRFGGEIVLHRKAKKGPFKYICDSSEGTDKISECGDKMHDGGHPCKGFYDETVCLPGLHPDGVEENPERTLDTNDDTFGSICFISGLGDSPSIQLDCKHIFHVGCIMEKIEQKWSGPRITFLFKTCPTGKSEIKADHHPEIKRLLDEANSFEEVIKKKALERAYVEKLDNDPRLKKAGDEYYNDLQKYAMARLSYYVCFKCKEPYFGGLKDGGNLLEAAADFKPEELVGGKGSSEGLTGQVDGPKHGKDYIEFKCRYCGNMSQWFCFGHTHFGNDGHRQAGSNVIKKCPGKGKCGLKVDHPDNGKEFPLGCGLGRYSAFGES